MTFQDAWKLDTGLREMDFAIHSCYFKTSADYLNNTVHLIFMIGSDESGQPYELRMPLGADWTSTDGGKTVRHPTRRRIPNNSIYGNWIKHAIAVPDLVDGRALHDYLFERGEPWVASIWKGFILHLEPTEITFGRNLDPVERLLPTRFIGFYAEQPLPLQQPPAPDIVATPSTPDELVAQARAAAQNNGSPLHDQMVELAKNSASFNEFLAAAFTNPEVLADDELAKEVANEQSGIWSLR